MIASGALSNLTILDLSRVLAGPWATQTLADLGATVIKVESPQSGDDTRAWGPPFLDNADKSSSDAAYFTTCNRNKRSITVDFSKPEGADILQKLAMSADVVVENFKRGGLARYNLDYASLSAKKPEIVYCSITGFGQTGPLANLPGYDFMIQGMAGLMSITGQPEGTPGHEPLKVGVAVCDLFTGMYAALSILAAISHRDRTGEGQYIDCALYDTQVAMLANQASNWLVGGLTPAPMGNSHPNLVPYRTFQASDGHLIIACGNDDQFTRLCHALDLKPLATDPRFLTAADRVIHRASLETTLADTIALYAKDTVLSLLQQHRVPCGPINTIPDVFSHHNTLSRELIQPLTRQDGTTVNTVAFPAKLSATPATYRIAPPTLGADTEAVLREYLEIDEITLQKLNAEHIISS